MVFIVSIIYALIFAYALRKPLKQKAGYFYIGTLVLEVFFVLIYLTKAYELIPHGVYRYTLGVFQRGAFATALFTIVMFTGCFDYQQPLAKQFYAIRGPLSIIASLLTLFHNLIYGITYFPMLFTGSAELSPNRMWATIVTLVLISLMLPLMITSFERIRKKMSAVKWKKLQRLAYPFYGLIYVHLMLLFIPKYLDKGRGLDTIIIYTVVFVGYAGLRFRKYNKEQKKID